MKVVLDTNVLISGIFFSGAPARILAAWADGRFEAVAGVEVLTEYRRVAERFQNKFPSIDLNAILRRPQRPLVPGLRPGWWRPPHRHG